MNWNQALVLAGLGVAVGTAGVFFATWWRGRARTRRAKRRDQLKSLGRRMGFDLLGPHVPNDLVEAAARFRGDVHGVSLDDVMVGSDREGRYWLARRRLDGEDHHVLGFEIRGELNVRGLHLEPRAPGPKLPRWRRWFARVEHGSSRLRLHMRWEADAARFEDELARQAVNRWLVHVAASCSASGKTPVGLEVHGDRAWVHSLVPLEGVALGEFLRRGLEVRRQVLDEVLRRPATLKAPAARMTAQERVEQKAGREDTAPIFAVGRTEQVEPEEANNTVLLSAADLLREIPDPRSKRRRRVNGDDDFEIPEPEEVVTLIRAR